MPDSYDILIRNCSVLNPDMTIAAGRTVAIRGGLIASIVDADTARDWTAAEVFDGRDKLAMPGLIDAHTHLAQQFLRGRTVDELPMIWARILIPFESNLNEEDVYFGAQLACLEKIKSGTTAFADAGGPYMHGVARAAVESGMRALVTRSTMDMGAFIPDGMKKSLRENMDETERLYKDWNGAGNGRVAIGFGMRQIMTCTPELIEAVAARAKELGASVHTHLCEHRDEVSFCLQKYGKRPAEFLDERGMLGPNMLAAHSVVLSESDIDLMKERDVKVVHCPRSNLGSHGFPKTPRLLQSEISVGMGTDGAAGSSLSLFDEMRIFRSAMICFWGQPIYDPRVIPVERYLQMATSGSAAALLMKGQTGEMREGCKADVILLDLDRPHLSPSHYMVATIVEAAQGADVTDSIIDGRVVMKNREVLTLDEQRIMAESKKRITGIAAKAGIARH